MLHIPFTFHLLLSSISSSATLYFQMSARGTANHHVSNPIQKPNSTTANRIISNKSCNGICGLRGSNQVSCIPSINKETTLRKHSVRKVTANKRSTGTCGIRLPKKPEFSPVRLLKHLRGKMAKGLSSVSLRKRNTGTTPAVSSSGRSKPYVIPVDTHRSEAIEDCIEFINSSSSLPRSNSASASAH